MSTTLLNELKDFIRGVEKGDVPKKFRKGNKQPKSQKRSKAKNEKRTEFGYNKDQLNIGGQNASTVKFGGGMGNYNFSPNGSEFVIERTEPVLSVVGSGTAGNFGLQQIKVLPMGPFRWLGNMANAFTSYEIQRMEFTYIPAVPTTTSGSISLSFQEDYRDDQPGSISDQLLSEQSLLAPVYGGTEGGRYLQRFGAPEGNVVSFEVPKHAIKGATGVPISFKIVKGSNFDAMVASGTEADLASTRQLSPGRVWIGTEGGTVNSQKFGQIFCRYRIKLHGAIAFGLNQ